MRRLALVGATVGILAVAATLLFGLARRTISQPIAFNHRLHVHDVGSQCVDCHLHAVSGVRATIPNIEVCGACHADPQTRSPEEARLVEHVRTRRLVPWRKVNRLPAHVYFSHRRHAGIAAIACTACHGDVASQTRPITRPIVRMTMDRCIECHVAKGARNDCVACHR